MTEIEDREEAMNMLNLWAGKRASFSEKQLSQAYLYFTDVVKEQTLPGEDKEVQYTKQE